MPADASTPPTGPRRVTSADVARESGVSRATVSYVLNGAPGRSISEATRRRVLDTAARLGHVPYAPARSLRLGRSDIVVALVRDYTIGYVANRTLVRLDAALADRGAALMVHRHAGEHRSMRELWSLVSPRVVVTLGGLDLGAGATEGTFAKLVAVHGTFDHRQAGTLAVGHLHGRGHTRIAYAYPLAPALPLVADLRLEGARREAERRGLGPLDLRTIDMADPSTAFDAIRAWTGAGDGAVSAIVAHNDELALFLIAALHKLGLEAGRDIAVIGIDNIPLARVSLTTIELVEDAYAGWIVSAVLAALDGEPMPTPAPEIYRLVIRDTA